jgi:hypothetical protein
MRLVAGQLGGFTWPRFRRIDSKHGADDIKRC